VVGTPPLAIQVWEPHKTNQPLTFVMDTTVRPAIEPDKNQA